MPLSMSRDEALEIRRLVIDEINTGLRENFRDPDEDAHKVYRYPLPFDWMPLASFIKQRYRDAGWIVQVSLELSCNRKERDCTLVFTTPNDKKRMR